MLGKVILAMIFLAFTSLGGCTVEEYYDEAAEQAQDVKDNVKGYFRPDLDEVCKEAGGRLVFNDEDQVECIK